ncbi:hypothetical protein HMI54_009379 [Coelomomyces lativittatus]|nr:hypothetical protein HMI54_009379 [Coelomomyces lativittatus]
MGLVGITVPIAKAAASCIKLDTFLLLFPVCHELNARLRLSPLEPILTLDKNIHYHRYLAYSLVFFSFIHIVAHYINFRILETLTLRSATWYAWASGPGLTGQIGTIAIFLLVTAAALPIRRTCFEIFWYAHHLFLVFFGSMLTHGAFCFIKADKEPFCTSGGDYWIYFAFGLGTYTLERLLREIRGRRKTTISKIISHPGNTLELQMIKASITTRPGQYIWINCPAISTLQWHPFTLTSCPEEGFISVHMRLVGNWTRSFAQTCGVISEKKPNAEIGEQILDKLPWVMVDGPCGTASEDWLNFSVIICVGAGIGVTPFASILKSIFYQTMKRSANLRVKKVYFYWICREANAFSWFQTLLLAIEQQAPDLVCINVYLTGGLKDKEVANIMLRSSDSFDVVTGLKSRTFFGKPNWSTVFTNVAASHPNTDIGVFFCGPEALSSVLYKASNTASYDEKYNSRFYYHKENF